MPFAGRATSWGFLPSGRCVRYLNSVANPTDDPRVPTVQPSTAELQPADDLPIVARMVIEIRSDGTRTVARGALEDQASGQRVSVQAEGTTPGSLAASLMKSLMKTPFFGLKSAPDLVRSAVRALLPGRGKSK
jgi:hypothetical protein